MGNPNVDELIVTRLPSWAKEFGNTSSCHCDDCQSVYGASAYFIELMCFLESSGLVDHLLARRPDLWDLKLDCANTTTEMPYVDLVNYVLESRVLALDSPNEPIPVYDVGDTTSEVLMAAPQRTNWAAYMTPAGAPRARLDTAAYPNSLPFDAALDAARGYLAHLGVSRTDLIRMFDHSAATYAWSAERLGMTAPTFALITARTIEDDAANAVGVGERFGWTVQPSDQLTQGDAVWAVWAMKTKLNAAGAALPVGASPAVELFDAATTAAVNTFQGAQGLLAGPVGSKTWAALDPYGPPLWSLMLPHIPTLLSRARLNYIELQQLLRTRFINPHYAVFDIARRYRLPGDDVKAYAAGGLDDMTPLLQQALTDAMIAPEDFADWANACLTGPAWTQVQRTLVIQTSASVGELDAAALRHWDDAVGAIDDSEWIRLDRLVRLWRGLGWDITDLDLVLSALQATEPTAEIVGAIATITDLAHTLNLTISQTVLLWADLEPAQPNSLYHKVFCDASKPTLDTDFIPDWRGRVLADKPQPGPAAHPVTLQTTSASLQAALRISDADFSSLTEALALETDSAVTIEVVSSLLRHVTLARALGLNVRDLLYHLDISASTISAAVGGHRILAISKPTTTAWPLIDFVTETTQLTRMGVSPALLRDITTDAPLIEADAVRDTMLADLSSQLQTITRSFSGQTDVIELLRQALAALDIDRAFIESSLQILSGTDQAGAMISAAVNPAPIIPPEWNQRVRLQELLDPTDKNAQSTFALTVTGAMTDAERNTISAFSADQRWKDAVDTAYEAPRTVLTQLIGDVSDALQGSATEAPTVSLLLATPVFAGPLRDDDAVMQRLKLLLDSIGPEAERRAQVAAVTQALLGVVPDEATLHTLLTGYKAETDADGDKVPVLPADAVKRPIIDDLLTLAGGMTDVAKQAYDVLTRLGQLNDVYALTWPDTQLLSRDVLQLRNDPARRQFLLGYNDVRMVAAYANCRDKAKQRGLVLAELWSLGDEDLAATLCRSAHAPESLVTDLKAALGLSSLHSPDQLREMLSAADTVMALGVAVPRAQSWTAKPTPEMADEIRHAIEARYDHQGWLTVAKSLNDPLRDARRRALVDYLVARINTLSSRDADGLYELLLLDVEMTSCMPSSPVRLAISTVQTFIGQIQLGMIAGISPKKIDQTQWRYLQNQTIATARREVLLKPENYLQPELRDDKTPEFKAFEAALRGAELTDETIEKAVADYLYRIDALAKLDVTTLHVQREFEVGEPYHTVVHVFGRSANIPRTYYYRRFEITAAGTQRWTPWEKVPVNIPVDIVAAATFERRLYLFWAQITTKDRPRPTDTDPWQDSDERQEVQLCWTEYRGGTWAPTHITDPDHVLKGELETNYWGIARAPFIIERLEVNSSTNRGAQLGVAPLVLTVYCIARRDLVKVSTNPDGSHQSFNGPHFINMEVQDPANYANQAQEYVLGTFTLDDCHGQLQRSRNKPFQRIAEDGTVLAAADGGLVAKALSPDPSSPTTILAKADPTTLGEEHWIHYGRDYFVFNDAQRTYFGSMTVDRPSLIGALREPHLLYPTVETGNNAKAAIPRDDMTVELTVDLDARARYTVPVSDRPWTAATDWLAASTGPALVSGAGDIGVDIKQITRPITTVNVARPTQVAVRFETLYDPFTCAYLKRLRQRGINGLLTLKNQQLTVNQKFNDKYKPTSAVQSPLPTDTVDFGYTGTPGVYRANATAVYHRELFIEIPMLLHKAFRAEQRFAEALQCLRCIWDYTLPADESWRAVPLRAAPNETIQDWLDRLSTGDSDLQGQIAEWRLNPFQPHLLARMRPSAYRRFVVMHTIETLLELTDYYFRLDTMESIGYATQCCVIAGHLSPTVEEISCEQPVALTYREIRGNADPLGNVAAEFENNFPNLAPTTIDDNPNTPGLLGIGRSAYFCVPGNDKLLSYSAQVAERLYKLRNCLDSEGTFRIPPLFEKRIDPMLLVRATAQGIDVRSVIADAALPLPHQSFTTVLRRALDACNAADKIGNLFNTVMERGDTEGFTALNTANTTAALKATLEVHKHDEDAAAARLVALRASREISAERFRYGAWLMGSDAKVPVPNQTTQMVPYGPRPQNPQPPWRISEEASYFDLKKSGCGGG